MNHQDDQEFEEYEGKSKSRLKREMQQLQDLGAELVKLSAATLRKMEMPEDLLDALLDWQRFTKHEAKRRQMQYIGKVMRDLDAEPIAAQLAAIRGESDAAKAEFHALERWRARLLEDSDALTEWLNEYPESDVQQLRQLIRNARKEAELGKPPRASRELFRLLRELSGAGQGHDSSPLAEDNDE